MDQAHLYRIMSGDDRTLRAGIMRAAMTAMQPAYAIAVATRNAMFNLGLRRPADLGRPTVSVGNLTTGGVGKTPMVIELARRLTAMGRLPAVLLRGYGEDETRELRDTLGDSAIVTANPDRAAGAQKAMQTNTHVSCFLLDDGFQHRQVKRELDIVLIDATRPFGFDHLLPRGLLREAHGSLRRADAVIVTHADQVPPEALASLDRRIEALSGKPPIAHTAHRWSALRDGNDQEHPTEQLRHKRVVGVCGIGNPQAFRHTLENTAKEVVRFITFDDHHAYQPAEIAAITYEDADVVVTTEKDWVKWKRLIDAGQVKRPVLRPVLNITFLDGADSVEEKLRDALHQSPGMAIPGL